MPRYANTRAFLERLQGTPDMTFQSLYDLYIEDKSHRIRQSTLDNTKCVFNTHILPYFKDKPINSITPTDIRTWQNGQIDSGASRCMLPSKCFFIRVCAVGKCWHSRWLILTSKQIPSMSARHYTGTAQAHQRQITAERIRDTVEMVNKVYGHLYPNKHNEVANRLNQLIVPN